MIQPGTARFPRRFAPRNDNSDSLAPPNHHCNTRSCLRRSLPVKGTRIAPSQADRPPQTLQELRVTVSSPRLDSVISAAFHLSRGSAADAVAAGRVNLNDLPCLKPDRAVQENDTVSVRGLGKLRVLALGGLTKKGRLALTLGKYL